jgi:hypothetical protein
MVSKVLSGAELSDDEKARMNTVFSQ